MRVFVDVISSVLLYSPDKVSNNHKYRVIADNRVWGFDERKALKTSLDLQMRQIVFISVGCVEREEDNRNANRRAGKGR